MDRALLKRRPTLLMCVHMHVGLSVNKVYIYRALVTKETCVDEALLTKETNMDMHKQKECVRLFYGALYFYPTCMGLV